MEAVEVVAKVLSLLYDSGRVRMTFTPKGLNLFLPFSFKRQPFTLTSMPSGKPVRLPEQELEAEYQRVKGLLDNLAADQRVTVELFPDLHFGQVYYIIKRLRANGFAVKPDAEKIVLSEKDGREGLHFRLTARKSVVLFVQRSFLNYRPAALQPVLQPVKANLDGLQLDELPMKQLIGLVPPNEAVMVEKEGPSEQYESGQNGGQSKPSNHGSERIDELLTVVQRDLKNRGVERLALDWSLVKRSRSHLGSRFLKRRSNEA
jgi:hypothetical protein